MDWSDDVTYAIHDLLDFYRAGLIPLEQVRAIPGTPGPNVERVAFLLRLFKRRPDWEARRSEYEAALDSILDLFPFDASHRYSGAESDEQLLYQFSTRLITNYVTPITPGRPGGTLVSVQQNARDEVDILKEFVWSYVILNPDLAVLQAGQRKAIRTVFQQFLLAAREERLHFFAVGFRPRIAGCKSDDAIVRVVADYVADMTERELINTYRRLEATIN
jgi:dGTPase